MPLALHYAARSDVGLLRDGNEDSGYAGPRLLVVADGMGGHVAGEVASAIAVASLVGLDEDAPGADLLDQLARAVHQANDELRRMAAEDPSLDGMGTTLTALLRAGSRLGLAHVGDSRCYLLRQGRLEQITRDHTFVQTLVDEGRISPEQAEQHPQRALITRALDGREDVEIDLSVREVRVGDRYLLCSDGLSNVVSAATIRDALAQADEPAQACERLLELALRGGGPDNVTCVIADVVDVSAAPPPVPEAVGAAAHDSRLRRPDPGGSSAERAAAHGRAASARADGTRGEGRQRRGQPPAARRGRWRWRPALVLSLLLGALAGGYAGWAWSQNQYYVGADGDAVAIFRGVGSHLVGRPLSSVLERQDLAVTALPAYTREQVNNAIPAQDLADARRILSRLQEQAAACAGSPAARALAAPPASATHLSGDPSASLGSRARAAAAPAPSAPAPSAHVSPGLPSAAPPPSGQPAAAQPPSAQPPSLQPSAAQPSGGAAAPGPCEQPR